MFCCVRFPLPQVVDIDFVHCHVPDGLEMRHGCFVAVNGGFTGAVSREPFVIKLPEGGFFLLLGGGGGLQRYQSGYGFRFLIKYL